MSHQRCATSGTDNPSRAPWHYAHAAGIEGLHWDIYAGEGVDGWLVASVGTEADAALIVADRSSLDLDAAWAAVERSLPKGSPEWEALIQAAVLAGRALRDEPVRGEDWLAWHGKDE